MKRPPPWLWWTAVVLGATASMAFAVVPSVPVVDLGGDVRFSLGQVLLVLALGAAWGDQRRQLTEVRDEQKRLRAELEAHKQTGKGD